MIGTLLKTSVLATLLIGCASTPAGSEAELSRTVNALRAQNTAYARKIEELENQVFVLTAELDTRRSVEPGRPLEPVGPPPTLPETKLRPGREVPQPETVEPPQSLVDETAVEYAGAAAEERSGKRPLLRLWGPGSSELDPAPMQEAAPERPSRAAVPTSVLPSGTAERPPVPGSSEVALYQIANDHLRAGATAEAMAAFRTFVKRFPNHELADNAQYWLGECFYHRKDYSMALREFRRVVEKFPRGNKVPDALLKLGFSYLALGSTRPGKETLTELARSYPRHPASGLATAKLAELAAEQGEQDGKESR
jgi:tol-pal system protein YbgF